MEYMSGVKKHVEKTMNGETEGGLDVYVGLAMFLFIQSQKIIKIPQLF